MSKDQTPILNVNDAFQPCWSDSDKAKGHKFRFTCPEDSCDYSHSFATMGGMIDKAAVHMQQVHRIRLVLR